MHPIFCLRIKEEKNVDESMSLKPLTDYSKFKADCEKILDMYGDDSFTVTSIGQQQFVAT